MNKCDGSRDLSKAQCSIKSVVFRKSTSAVQIAMSLQPVRRFKASSRKGISMEDIRHRSNSSEKMAMKPSDRLHRHGEGPMAN